METGNGKCKNDDGNTIKEIIEYLYLSIDDIDDYDIIVIDNYNKKPIITKD